MSNKFKNILLLYTDKYYLVKQVYPFGLDIIANHLRRFGHEVTIEYPFLTESNPETNLREILNLSNPDFIGLGIRNLDTTMSCEKYGNQKGFGYQTFYFLNDIINITNIIKKLRPDIPIIAGGGAFTISPSAILKILGIRYGIAGEGEEPLRQFLEAFPDEEKISVIPNLVINCEKEVRINPKLPFTFRKGADPIHREGKFNYAYETTGLPVRVKRGCNQNCSYCVEPIIEGRNFSYRNPDDVVTELKTIAAQHDGIRSIFFTDTEFNVPNLEYGSALVRKIIQTGLNDFFRFSSQFLPKPFHEEFAGLLSDAGFSVILTCDSFADEVLKMNRSSYRRRDIIKTLEMCSRFGIDCTVNLIFGLPGETHETIDVSLKGMMQYPPNARRRYEYTFGGRIYHGTPLARFVESRGDPSHIYGNISQGYLEPCFYCSPENPFKLKTYIESILPFKLDFQNNYDRKTHQTLAISYLVDQGKWEHAAEKFLKSDLAAQSAIYDYLFRKMADCGKTELAETVSRHLIQSILQSGEADRYGEQISLIHYYIGVLHTAG